MKFSYCSNRHNKAVALLLVIAVVALLGAIVFGLRIATEPSWEQSTLEYIRFDARLLAESGANLAQHPDISLGHIRLQQLRRKISVALIAHGEPEVMEQRHHDGVHTAVVV